LIAGKTPVFDYIESTKEKAIAEPNCDNSTSD